MFQPQRIYIDNKDKHSLLFDTIVDNIKPIQAPTTQKSGSALPFISDKQTETTKMTAKLLNNESDAVMRALGVTFCADVFIAQNFKDKNEQQKVALVLMYLTKNIDPSILHFTQSGGIVFQNNLVPNSDLTAVLKNMVSKKSKTLITGEYFLLHNLAAAPQTLKAMINPSKLKLCNIQSSYNNQGPALTQTPTVKTTPNMAKTKVQIRTAHPQVVNTAKLTQSKTSKLLLQQTRQPSKVQTQFKPHTVPAWYKIL